MSPRLFRRLSCASLPLFLLAARADSAPASGQAPAAPFESPGKVQASQWLTPEQLSGTEWRVAPEATSDGLFNLYSVASRFGNFQARGRMKLGFRVKEVEALAELDKVSKSKLFTDAVAKSAVAPVQLEMSSAESPSESAQGDSNGVQRIWSKSRFQAKEVSPNARGTVAKESGAKAGGAESEASQSDRAKEATAAYATKYLELSAAERRWFGQLGVDPYTDNKTVRDAVKEISRVEAAASFGVRFVGLPPIPGARELGTVMDLVWSTDPWELRQRNRKILLDAGLNEDTARAFEDNAAMSPTLQTALLQCLVDLEGVAGRQNVVARAIGVEDAEAARMLVTSTALLVRYHRQIRPLAEILPGARLPVGRTKDGRLIAVAAVDEAFWTADVAAGVRDFAAIYDADQSISRELRVVGQASDRFKAEAGALGWRVIDHWQLAAPDDAAPAAKPADAKSSASKPKP